MKQNIISHLIFIIFQASKLNMKQKVDQDVDDRSSFGEFLEVPNSTPRLRLNKQKTHGNQATKSNQLYKSPQDEGVDPHIKRIKTLNKPQKSPSVVDVDVQVPPKPSKSSSLKDLLQRHAAQPDARQPRDIAKEGDTQSQQIQLDNFMPSFQLHKIKDQGIQVSNKQQNQSSIAPSQFKMVEQRSQNSSYRSLDSHEKDFSPEFKKSNTNTANLRLNFSGFSDKFQINKPRETTPPPDNLPQMLI